MGSRDVLPCVQCEITGQDWSALFARSICAERLLLKLRTVNAQMRKDVLRRYLVFRVKAIEMLDIGAVRQAAESGNLAVANPVGRLPSDFVDSIRTPHLSWFALLIDKNGMDAIKLWGELFPKHRVEINETWTRIEPAWNIIRAFRDKAGFHADKPRAFFKARREIVEHHQEIAQAIADFQKLFRTILHAEATELPDFSRAVDEFLDEIEAENQSKYNRAEFKRYLMIP